MIHYSYRFCLVASLLAGHQLLGAEPSPFEKIDAKRIPAKLKPPGSAPAETLVQLGLRDGRWDTIAVRPDGKLIVVSDPSGSIMTWSVPGFQSLGRVPYKEAVVLAFSADSKFLAAGDAKGNLKMWVYNGNAMVAIDSKSAPHKGGPLWAIAFAPDGKMLATAGSDRVIKLWDIQLGKLTLRATIEAHEKVIRQIAFSPDGSVLASAGSSDKIAKLWDVKAAKPALKAELHCDGPVASVSFAPDGNALATASFDGKVRIWKLEGDTATAEVAMDMPKKSVRFVQFSPDGKVIAALVLDERGEHIAIRGRNGEKLHDWEFNHHMHGIAFADSRHLVTANEDSVYVLRLGAVK